MFDILRFVYPNASAEYLISISNVCVIIGWVFVFLGASGLIIESIGQKRLFYEAFPMIILGIFWIISLGMHSDFSIYFIDYAPILTLYP